jgi:hypothetical protein
MQIFNRMSLNEYLNITYNILTKNEERTMYRDQLKCIVYICSFHLLKNVVKHVKSIESNPITMNFFVYCFTILQFCTTLGEFERQYKNIFHVFVQKKRSPQYFASLEAIDNALEIRLVLLI